MTVGQKAKEISLISREIPQEDDFSAKQNNRSRTDAFRKLFHTRSKVTVLLMNDYIDDKNLREEAVRQASPDELASGNAYVDDFLKTLNETDYEITKLLLQKYTQQEIAGKLGINQSTVSKHSKKIQNRLLDFDPEIRKILPLFHNAQ